MPEIPLISPIVADVGLVSPLTMARRLWSQCEATLENAAPLCWDLFVFESPEELNELQRLLDKSSTGAGAHLREIITDERRLNATQLVARLQGMALLVVATTTADGQPLVGPVDGYFIHGSFYFT